MDLYLCNSQTLKYPQREQKLKEYANFEYIGSYAIIFLMCITQEMLKEEKFYPTMEAAAIIFTISLYAMSTIIHF